MSQTIDSSPEATPSNPVRPWYHPGIADLLFAVAALLSLHGARHSQLDDPGLGWHIRNIDAIWAHGGWLTRDPFTDPRVIREPQLYYTNQWLGDLCYWLGWHWAGLEGIAVVNALVIACIGRLFYRMLIADDISWPVAFLWSILVLIGTACSWTARPNVFTILFLLITARACVLLHEGRLRWPASLWLLPLFAIWANTHGGFVGGLVTLVAALGFEGICVLLTRDAEARGAGWDRVRHLALLVAGAGAATLVNPYGFRLYSWVFSLLGVPFFMTLHDEWRSPDFQSAGAMRYELLILLFPLLVGWSARRPHLVELGLSVLWLHFALTGFRYVPLWVVVAGPLLARSFVAIRPLQELAASLELGGSPDSLFAIRRGSTSWMWTLVAVVALFGWARLAQGTFAFHGKPAPPVGSSLADTGGQPDILAPEALHRLLAIHEEIRQARGTPPIVFHSYNWGGYLIWHGWPAVHIWIDDRNEVQGEKRIEGYLSIRDAEPGWEKKLADAGVQLVCIEASTPLARELASNAGWRERYRDKQAVIFERKAAAN
jgi:hypothetical protein